MTEKEHIFSDDDIVRSIQEGRVQNFETLVNRYKKKIVNFIYKMIFDYDEAQSLAQDVFLKVFTTLKKYKSQGNFQAFIFTVAKNLTLNHIKKQKRISWFSGQSPFQNGETEKYFRSDETPQVILEKNQQEEMLTAALKGLNENQRLALIMKVYLEYSYQEIKAVTGWSVPKIETLISRAKSNLKNEIRSNLQAGETKGLQKKMQEKRKRNVLQMNARST